MESKEFKDYYYILGISKDATPEMIEHVYNELYDKYGPHVSIAGLDPDMMMSRFRDISEAYETLMNPIKRAEYDKKNEPHMHKSDLRALWSKYSGIDAKKDQIKNVVLTDTVQEVSVTLREALKGCKKKTTIDEPKLCLDCVGLKPVLRLQCPNCRGLGYTSSKRSEELEIPAGTYDKVELRFEQLGKYDLHAEQRAPLVIRIKIEPHKFFSILNRDITCTIPITLYEAILGAEIEVPTTTGKVIMRIQPMTQSGQVYRLKGLGLAGADQLITVDIVTPQRLSSEEIELFRKLQKLNQSSNPRTEIFANM